MAKCFLEYFIIVGNTSSHQLKQHLTFGEMVTFEWDPEKELRFHIATGERYVTLNYDEEAIIFKDIF